jgi:hypothetical protein
MAIWDCAAFVARTAIAHLRHALLLDPPFWAVALAMKWRGWGREVLYCRGNDMLVMNVTRGKVVRSDCRGSKFNP